MNIKIKKGLEIKIKDKNKFIYNNKKTYKPKSKINQIKNICLKTPMTDLFLFFYIIICFYNFEIISKKYNKKYIKIKRNKNFKLKNIKILIIENYKQYIIISIIFLIISNLI